MKFPGFSPKAPSLPAPAPVVTRADPAIAEAAKKLKASEKLRKGRASTIITGGAGVTGNAPLSQPRAGASVTLG